MKSNRLAHTICPNCHLSFFQALKDKLWRIYNYIWWKLYEEKQYQNMTRWSTAIRVQIKQEVELMYRMKQSGHDLNAR